MRRIAVCIRDAKAECFGTPFFVSAKGVAIRDFTNRVNTPGEDNPLNRFPEDFSLWMLGYYDDVEGVFEGLREQLVDALSVAVRE